MSAVSYKGVEKRFDRRCSPCARSTSTSRTASSSCCSGPRAAARRPRCASSPGSSCRPRASVYIGDRDVTRLQPRDRDIAMVFQSYALYPHMTVAENVGYPLRIRKLEQGAAARSRCSASRESLEIDHLLDRRPSHLSGGQRQRVALARAIVREPAVFLMDEPLSNLDAKLRMTMRGEIKRLQTRLGTTTLYVTHDQAEAMTMADLVAVMRDGELQQLGSPDEIYDRPANRFVATFVGSPPMNVLEASVDSDSQSLVDRRLAPRAARPDLPRVPEASARVLGIRPEDLDGRPAEPAIARASRARSTWSSRWATRRWSTCASASSA